jgi:GNAT superfamily N-acetyltransferase
LKGLKVIKAGASNAIDVYALLKEWAKESRLKGEDSVPSDKKLQQYFFTRLIAELQHPLHLVFLARRGRGFLGYLHAALIPGRWDGQIDTIVIERVYVTGNRRKQGIGRKLLDELKKEAENMGIKRVELLSEDGMRAYWQGRGAKAVANYMRISL